MFPFAPRTQEPSSLAPRTVRVSTDKKPHMNPVTLGAETHAVDTIVRCVEIGIKEFEDSGSLEVLINFNDHHRCPDMTLDLATITHRCRDALERRVGFGEEDLVFIVELNKGRNIMASIEMNNP